MNSKQIDKQIQQRVEDFASDLSDLIHQAALASVREALDNAGLGAGTSRTGSSSAPASKKKTSKKRSTKKRGRRAKAPSEASLSKIVTYVNSNPGIPVGDIAKGTGMQSEAAKKAVATLLEEGSLRKTGQRRGTKYFVK